MNPFFSNRSARRLGQNKPFWFLVSFLVLCVIIGLYILSELQEEGRDRIFQTRVLSIPAEGEFYFGRDKIAMGDLALRIKEFDQGGDAGEIIYIFPGNDVKQGTVITAIRLIQEAGHSRISFPTEIKQGNNLGSLDAAILVSGVRCDQNKPRAHVVTFDGERGTYHAVSLNGRHIQHEDLLVEFKQELDQSNDKVVYVKTGEYVSYGELVKILHVIKLAGAKRMEFEFGCDSININQ